MMKKIILSTLCVSLLSVTCVYAEANKVLEKQGIEIANGWKLMGDIRAGWVEYNYKNSPKSDASPTYPNRNKGHVDSQGIYTMPKISILSPTSNNIQAKVTVAGATDFGINDEKYENRNFVFDSNNKKSFILLQEGYLSFDNAEHKFLVGREELSTPMVDADDWYMLANSFELAYYTNKSLKNTKIYLGYFDKMAGVWDSAANGTEFHSMADASYLDERDKKNAQGGMAFGAFDYNDNTNHNIKVWNYYAFDLYNTLFMQYDYTNYIKNFNYDIGVQIIDFKEIGKNKYTAIDYSLFSARFDGDFSNGINFATGISKYTDGKGQDATLGAFGGYPYFANGMIFHFFEAGSLQNASSYKTQIGYDFSKLGLNSLWLGYRYTYFDLDSNYSTNATGQAQNKMLLNGIRLSYGTKLGVYFTGTYEHVDLDSEPNTYSLRLIGGYKF